MKNHFKHATGYLNIDDSAVYFTISGNWEETKKLNEKTNGIPVKQVFKNMVIVLIVSVLLGALLVYAFLKVDAGGIAVVGLISVPFTVYKILTYFQADLALKFYIPLKKIIQYRFSEGNTQLTIRFYNQEGKEEEIEVTGLEMEYHARVVTLLNGLK